MKLVAYCRCGSCSRNGLRVIKPGPWELVLLPAIENEQVVAVCLVGDDEFVGAAEGLALPWQLVADELVLVGNASCRLCLSDVEPRPPGGQR